MVLLEWLNTGSMTTARYRHTASVLKNGKVLVTGGMYNSEYLNSTELYDPSTGNWTSAGNMNSGRQSHTESVLTNGTVLVVGGFNGTNLLNSAELYDPSTETWTAT
ncbi:unnamed protein product, partial [Rotaria sp. Silwood2]